MEITVEQAFGEKIIFAMEGGHVLGMVHVSTSDRVAPTGYIYNLKVFPAHQGKGVATGLIGAALAEGGWYAYVRDDNTAALEVFARTGFQERHQMSHPHEGYKVLLLTFQ